ncbi:DUF2726 domain-containing protein [Aquabacterium sp.]|uniref:DUF2726 domain-containing protein n=1 Tax=Aquabacterium sp. TaxID=1872578 RepID=UPI002C1DA92A|nr:DUF2726 domain-containing protein [Aquabacterium sp.]HSW06122.1 DUF2726 domain-containing protein [Aquabacterium sp.]
MMPVDATAVLALATALVLILSLFAARRRRPPPARGGARRDNPDTVQAFTPVPVRVLTVAERQAHTLLRQAMPGYLVLGQVPLSRFMSVPHRHAEWLQRISGLSADLLLCDSGSRVLAVIDVRPTRLSDNSRRRHERMTSLLRKAGIKVLSWQEEALPDVAMVRNQLLPMLAAPSAAREATANSRPMPMIPVAEILAEGDSDHEDTSMEPVPSAMFDDFEPVPVQAR